MVVVGQFDSPAFHQQAEEYATALEGIHVFEKVCRSDSIFDQGYMYCMLYKCIYEFSLISESNQLWPQSIVQWSFFLSDLWVWMLVCLL